MCQETHAEEGFEKYRKPTRREQFLDEMNRLIPWAELAAVIDPFYPRGEGRGRPPIGVERLRLIHFLQHGFNLSDQAVEQALDDSRALRSFVGIDLGREPVPDETTICKFRHLLERHPLGEQLFTLIGEYLQENGLKVHTGTIVDATIISAPSSTKNKERRWDPERRQTRKGNQWFFGMKAPLGVDSRTQLIPSVVATPAHVHDSRVLPDLLHGGETRVWGDAAYAGQGEALRRGAPRARDFTQRKGHRDRALTEAERERNRARARVRDLVEHPFLVLKRLFGFTKVRDRGLEKNAPRLFVACGLVNLYWARRRLLRRVGIA